MGLSFKPGGGKPFAGFKVTETIFEIGLINYNCIMKKTILVLMMGMLIVACSQSARKAAEAKAAEEKIAAGKAAAEKTALIAAGNAVYTDKTKCARCHKPKDVTAYTQERWTGILKKMVPMAKLDETEAKQVTAYVMENAKK